MVRRTSYSWVISLGPDSVAVSFPDTINFVWHFLSPSRCENDTGNILLGNLMIDQHPF